jgi:hypothetical protein
LHYSEGWHFGGGKNCRDSGRQVAVFGSAVWWFISAHAQSRLFGRSFATPEKRLRRRMTPKVKKAKLNHDPAL